MSQRMQAKDVPEPDIIAAIRQVTSPSAPYTTAALWDIQKALPQYPPKVVLARLRSMVRRRVIGAQCVCGCRGDFTLDADAWYPRARSGA